MRELLIGFDDCFLSFLKRLYFQNTRTILDYVQKCSKNTGKAINLELQNFKNIWGKQNVSVTPWPVKVYGHAHLSGGFAPAPPPPLLSNMFRRHCIWQFKSLATSIYCTSSSQEEKFLFFLWLHFLLRTCLLENILLILLFWQRPEMFPDTFFRWI